MLVLSSPVNQLHSDFMSSVKPPPIVRIFELLIFLNCNFVFFFAQSYIELEGIWFHWELENVPRRENKIFMTP